MSLNDDNLLNELVVESREHLTSIEPDLLALEKGEEVSKESINKIFRAIHSIKGGFGFFGMESIKELSHVMENLMMKVRDGDMQTTPDMVDALLAGVDKLRVMLDDVHNSDDIDFKEEKEKLAGFLNKDGAEAAGASVTESVDISVEEITLKNIPVGKDKLLSLAKHGQHVYVLTVFTKKDMQAKNRSPLDFIRELESYGEFLDSWMDLSAISGLSDCMQGEMAYTMVFSSVLEPQLIESAIDVDSSQIKTFTKQAVQKEFGTSDSSVPVAKKSKTAKPVKSVAQKGKAAKPAEKHSEVSETIRVRVDLLNKLVNLAGELVLGRNQLMQRMKNNEEAGLKGILQNIDMVTSDMQESIMNTRMQPIGNIFGKFPRIIRDLARKMNKEIDLSLFGENVELDKSIIESLTDPLTHLIRNCADHGVETPEEREKAGKSRIGHVSLRAFHEGGQVNIEIKDDGKGIDVQAVKGKAVENGILSNEDSEKLTDREAFNLIFEPGFSTAKQVTEVSGRGVGMDVVRTNIENLGGVIEVNSIKDKGTTITLKLPLTLAIIPSLIITADDRRLAIPQVSLVELVHIRAGDVSTRIENIQGKEVFRLRDKLLPVVRLDKVLGMPPVFEHPETGEMLPDRRGRLADRRSNEKEPSAEIKEKRTAQKDRRQSSKSAVNIVVLKVGSNHFGLVVDKLLDNEETVVKPLSSYLKGCRYYSGATIMGDGKVAMILDAVGISEEAGLRFGDMAAESRKQAERYEQEMKAEKQTLLLFKNTDSEIFGINLSLVARVEQVKADAVERIGEKEYVKYSDSSLRVVRVSDYMPVKKNDNYGEYLYVIVPKLVKHPMGIVASDVLDVVETDAQLDKKNVKGTGIHGSMVVDGKMIVLIDIYSLFEAAEPEIYRNSELSKHLEGARVLLAEDTAFFRSLEQNYLESLGCSVDTVNNGREAWEKLHDQSYDLLVTDIEMPFVDGFELTRMLRSDDKLKDMPVVALTSLVADDKRVTGEEAGVDAYETKLDKERLGETIAKVVKEKAK